MTRSKFVVFALFPIATLFAYVLARALLPTNWQRSIYAENGPIELGTAFFFALAGMSALALAYQGRHGIPQIYRGLFIAAGVMCCWVALEEISYGQQLFGWQSPPWFARNNHHGQTNLHNLMGNRPSHVLKNLASYGSLIVFIVLPITAMRWTRAHRPGHWTYFLLPKMELLVVAGAAQLCAILWDVPKSVMGTYWHQGWNELRELFWSLTALLYFIVLRQRLMANGLSNQAEFSKLPQQVQALST